LEKVRRQADIEQQEGNARLEGIQNVKYHLQLSKEA